MIDADAALGAAMSDAGYFINWDDRVRDELVVSFGSVRLLMHELKKGAGAPDYRLALKFINPQFVGFLKDAREAGIDENWFESARAPSEEAFRLDFEEITFSSERQIDELVSGYTCHVHLGFPQGLSESAAPIKFAFRAGDYGMVVRAESLKFLGPQGELDREQMSEAVKNWWAYWRNYWQLKGTANALPKDLLCEINIPVAGNR